MMEQNHQSEGQHILSNCQQKIKKSQNAIENNDQLIRKAEVDQAKVQDNIDKLEKEIEQLRKEILEVNQINTKDQVEYYPLQPNSFQDVMPNEVKDIENKQQFLLNNVQKQQEELENTQDEYDKIKKVLSNLELELLQKKLELVELQNQYEQKFKGKLCQLIVFDDEQNDIQIQIVQQLMNKLEEQSIQLKQINQNQIQLENKILLQNLQQNRGQIEKEIGKQEKELEEIQKELTKEDEKEEQEKQQRKQNYLEISQKIHGQYDEEYQQKLLQALDQQFEGQQRIKKELVIKNRDKVNIGSVIAKKKQDLSNVQEQIDKMINQSSNVIVAENQNKQQQENNIDQEQLQFIKKLKNINLEIKLIKARIDIQQHKLSQQRINAQNTQKNDLEQAMKILQIQLTQFNNKSLEFHKLLKSKQELMHQLDTLKFTNITLQRKLKKCQEKFEKLQQKYGLIIQQSKE